MSREKLRSMWKLLRAKHFAVLVGNTKQDIDWAILTLQKEEANQLNKSKGE